MLFISTFIKKRLVRVRRFASQWECEKEQTSPLSLLRQRAPSLSSFHVISAFLTYWRIIWVCPWEPSRCLPEPGPDPGPASGLRPVQLVAQGPVLRRTLCVAYCSAFLLRKRIISEQQTLRFHLSLGRKLWSQSCPGHPPTFHLCSIHPACFVGTLWVALSWVDLSRLLWVWSKRKSK